MPLKLDGQEELVWKELSLGMIESIFRKFQDDETQLQLEPGLTIQDFVKNTWSRMNVGSACRVLGDKVIRMITMAKQEKARGNLR